jgi:hypothetical protein
MITIFLGPSMPLAEARAIIDADFRPPAAMGDVLRAVSDGAQCIAIVDGVFERVPSVWHKEILFALSRGIPVYGASSMGALRAVECHAFGMIGVGRVFESFRDGVLEDDDEVAVAHASAEHGYRCLSDAMVNIREAVRDATARGILSNESAGRLLGDAKRRFYADRHWAELIRATWLADEGERLRAELPTPPDVKRADAHLLLTELRRFGSDGIPRHVPSFDFETTSLWQAALAKECAVSTSGDGAPSPVSRWKLASHLRLTRSDRRELSREALRDLLLAACASRIGGANPGGTFVDAFAGCANAEELRARLDRASDVLVRRLGAQLEPFLAVAVARRGDLPKELARASRKWSRVAERGLEWPQAADAGVDLQALSDWYEAEFAPLDEGGEAHARALGFASWEEFMGELVAEYIDRGETTSTKS